MPVVLSYENVEALGALAHMAGQQAGEARGNEINRNLNARIQGQRDQTAARLEGIQARSRDADLDRQLQAQEFSSRQNLAQRQQGFAEQQFGAEQAFNQQQLAEQQKAARARLAEAGIDAQAGLDQQHAKAAARQQRDAQLHQYDLEDIAAKARYNPPRSPGSSASSGPAYGPGGMPNDKAVDFELQRFGKLIPYQATSPTAAAMTYKDTMGQAKNLASLPTAQLQAMIQSQPSGEWSPYLRAIVQSRAHTAPANPANQSDAVAGGGHGGAALTHGTSYADPKLEKLSDAQLRKLANDPALLDKLLGP